MRVLVVDDLLMAETEVARTLESDGDADVVGVRSPSELAALLASRSLAGVVQGSKLAGGGGGCHGRKGAGRTGTSHYAGAGVVGAEAGPDGLYTRW